MLNKLIGRYPNAIVSSIPDNRSEMIWFFLDENEDYIGIPLSDLTQSEMELLKALFPIHVESKPLNTSSEAKKWHRYLFESDIRIPVEDPSSEYRIIQFTISQNKFNEFDRIHWEEAIKSLFPEEIVIVFHSLNEGVIIEKKHEFLLTENDLSTSIQALESDFYLKLYFYIGQFRAMEKGLNMIFQLEKNLYRFMITEMPQTRIFTLSHALPLFLLKSTSSEFRNTVFANIHDTLHDDPELLKTIMLYLENHANTSLTAKQLYMHRNSLQYRIDKFIEKTGHDLKSFSSSMIVYLACIDFLSQSDQK